MKALLIKKTELSLNFLNIKTSCIYDNNDCSIYTIKSIFYLRNPDKLECRYIKISLYQILCKNYSPTTLTIALLLPWQGFLPFLYYPEGWAFRQISLTKVFPIPPRVLSGFMGLLFVQSGWLNKNENRRTPFLPFALFAFFKTELVLVQTSIIKYMYCSTNWMHSIQL